MKVKGFRGDALIERGSRGVRQNNAERKFGFSSNSLRSGPPRSTFSTSIVCPCGAKFALLFGFRIVIGVERFTEVETSTLFGSARRTVKTSLLRGCAVRIGAH
jgi:hypothetical protein